MAAGRSLRKASGWHWLQHGLRPHAVWDEPGKLAGQPPACLSGGGATDTRVTVPSLEHGSSFDRIQVAPACLPVHLPDHLSLAAVTSVVQQGQQEQAC